MLSIVNIANGRIPGGTMTNEAQAVACRELCKSSAPYSNGQRCNGGGCPGVFVSATGMYLVVGRRLSAAEKSGLAMDAVEDALEVPAELLHQLVERLKTR